MYCETYVVPANSRDRALYAQATYRTSFAAEYLQSELRIRRPVFVDPFTEETSFVLPAKRWLKLTAQYRADYARDYPGEDMYVDDVSDWLSRCSDIDELEVIVAPEC